MYMGAGTHALGLPVQTQALLDFVPSVFGTNRNITTDNYYTSFPLALELKSQKLTLVGTMKKKKACIPPSSLAKADEGTVQYAFDHQTISLCCPLLQRKTRGSYSCPICIPKKKTDEDNEKEEIIVLQPGKR
jgi:hypothetical protein